MVQPVRPAGGPGPVHRPTKPTVPAAGKAAFEGRLKEGLQAGGAAAPAPADPRLLQVQRFAARALGTEAWEARLLESYDALSADEGLYEVQTSKGPYQVIRSRMGALSIYPGS